jgi:hypothetical protein
MNAFMAMKSTAAEKDENWLQVSFNDPPVTK